MADTTTIPVPPTGVPTSKYTTKTYDGNKYSVSGYEYPSDLMGKNAEYGGNYVIFYINVSEDSKMLKNNDPAKTGIDTVAISADERVKKAITGLDLNSAKVMAFTAGGAAGLGKIAGVSGLSFANNIAINAGVGLTTGANLTANTSNFTRAQKRLQTAIALHVPNDLSIKYGAGWGEEETFATSAIIGGASELAAAGGNLIKGSFTASGENLKGVSGIVGAATLKGPGGSTLGIASGMAPNPKKEQAFSGVDFRTFTFSYRFAPRSSAEAKNVLNIVNTFKYHMHPEYKDTKGFLFLYPSEFDIVYYHGSEENLKIHRHTSCVLTDLSINYAPNGVFNTFPDGMPTELSVQMTFKELTILTKELIQEGL